MLYDEVQSGEYFREIKYPNEVYYKLDSGKCVRLTRDANSTNEPHEFKTASGNLELVKFKATITPKITYFCDLTEGDKFTFICDDKLGSERDLYEKINLVTKDGCTFNILNWNTFRLGFADVDSEVRRLTR